MVANKKSTKSNTIIYILLSPLLILKYALIGLKVITIDLIVSIFNFFSFFVDKFYRKAAIKNDVSPINNFSLNDKIDKDYYRLKGTKKSKIKTYKYSKRYLKKLEFEKNKLENDLEQNGSLRSDKPILYLYKVKNTEGKIITSTMMAYSKLDINAFLVNEGYIVYFIKSGTWINIAYKDTKAGSRKLKTKEIIFLLTQLSAYLKAGLTLNNSLKILSNQLSTKSFKYKAYEAIRYELVLGESFSVALEKQGSLLPALLINMIKAAEASGTMIQTLDNMIDYYTEMDKTKKQMTTAMMYPLTILFFSVAVIIFMMVYIVPQFSAIYGSSTNEISGITLFVINASDYLKTNIISIIFGTFIIVLSIIFLYKNIKAFRTIMQLFLMKLPVIKNVIIYNEMTIISKSFASLLKNNVFITDSITLLSRVTTNEIYKVILYKTMKNVVEGEKISEAFEGHWAVPEVAYQMIVTGEETGDLANMMQNVADYYQTNHKNVVTNMKTLLEPILITILAFVVGFIIIAVIVPIYGVMDTTGL